MFRKLGGVGRMPQNKISNNSPDEQPTILPSRIKIVNIFSYQETDNTPSCNHHVSPPTPGPTTWPSEAGLPTSKVDPGDPDPALSCFEIQHFCPFLCGKGQNFRKILYLEKDFGGMFLFVCLEVGQCLSMYGQWSGVL